MKFGGSSLANAERIDYVAKLIKGQIKAGYRPRAVVCSAMGKTTNSLLAAGDFALDGRVCVDAIRTLHQNTCNEFDYPNSTRGEIEDLLDEVSVSICNCIYFGFDLAVGFPSLYNIVSLILTVSAKIC